MIGLLVENLDADTCLRARISWSIASVSVGFSFDWFFWVKVSRSGCYGVLRRRPVTSAASNVDGRGKRLNASFSDRRLHHPG
jgi:hypothetical protein